ncbi:TetR/AcrR family transcriptional regulator [Aquirhabdus sp.]|uniref:TetR/AcrR family transcriptional regulator n=1 Tax=Aquirhabdus sp. TaxID=2824160 RepID=UPI00396C5B32
MSDLETSTSINTPEEELAAKPLPESRMPLQERSQQRVAKALTAAVAMLERLGPEETSISEIAKEAGIPRVSLYQFFPSKYVLYTHLSKLYLGELRTLLIQLTPAIRHKSWQEVIVAMIHEATVFYNKTPAASILLLGRSTSRAAHLVQKSALNAVGQEIHNTFASLDRPLYLPTKPDVAELAIDIGFACMKHGYYRDNYISPTTETEAARAVIGYVVALNMQIPIVDVTDHP